MSAESSQEPQVRFGVLFVLTAVLAVYGHTLHVPWYLDDYVTILDAPQVQNLRGSIGAFFSPRGLTQFTFALNYHLGGFALPGFHLVNISIHAAAAVLVWLLLRRIVPRRPVAALLGALLFAVHPLQTQAVTYLTQRITSLSALLVLLALYLYVRAREILASGTAFGSNRHLRCYLGALLAGSLAVFAKENAVVLPVLLFLFDRYFLTNHGLSRRRQFIALLPFLVVPLYYSCVRFFIPLLSGTSLNILTSYRDNAIAVSPLRYLVTEFSVLWIYLRLFFLPYHQVIEYDYPVITAWLSLQNIVAGIGLLALGGLAWGVRKRVPLLSFGIVWFFASLAIESSFIPLDPLFEHRLYLPCFGLIAALVGMLALVPSRGWGIVGLGTFVLLMALLAWQRNSLWNDPVAFYAAAVHSQPQNAKMLAELALARLGRGEIDGVEPLLRKALIQKPRDYATHAVLFSLLLRRGRWKEAEDLIIQAAQAGSPPKMLREMRLLLINARH